MGTKTRAQLISQAALAAGNEQAGDYIRPWLNDWLQRTGKSWSWPLLHKSVGNLVVPAGQVATPVGVGAATEVQGVLLTTHHIHRLMGGYVFWRDASTYNTRGRAFVRPLYDANPDTDERITDPNVRKGLPETLKVRQTADGALTLYLNPVPDRSLILAFDVHWLPPSMSTDSTDDGLSPWYPNDRTLEQACKCAILEMDAGGENATVVGDALNTLGAMVVDDRDFDGEQAGDNQEMEMDPSVFVPGPGRPGSWRR